MKTLLSIICSKKVKNSLILIYNDNNNNNNDLTNENKIFPEKA